MEAVVKVLGCQRPRTISIVQTLMAEMRSHECRGVMVTKIVEASLTQLCPRLLAVQVIMVVGWSCGSKCEILLQISLVKYETIILIKYQVQLW